MASDSRALTLKLLADTADFQKKLEAGSKDVESIGERVTDFGKKAALAFAAAGAAVGAFAVSAVKAAAEDEAAQKQLANTIQATTNATAQQIAGVEEYIRQTSIAIGVTDDQLRPAFSRLVRSTKDVEDAQRLLNLALDIASATGRPLESIANALGRAYDGNTTALGRLGLGLDASVIKSKDFDAIFKTLTSTFGNFAENEALSTEKQMARVKIALDEAKESIGAALLPVVQQLTQWILNNFIPALDAFIAGLTGQGGLDGALTESQKTAIEWGKKVRGFIDTVIELKDEIIIMAGVMAAAFTVSKIAAGVTALISIIKGLITVYNALKASAIVAGVAQAFALNPLLGVGAVALGAAVLSAANALANKGDVNVDNLGDGGTNLGNRPLGGRMASLTGGSTSGTGLDLSSFAGASSGGSSARSGSQSQPTLIEQVAQENFIKNMAPGNFDPSAVRRADERGNIIVNVSGAIDPVSTARQIQQILVDESTVAGNFTGGYSSRFSPQVL